MDHRSQGRAPMRLQSVMTLVNRQQKRGARSPDCAERCRAAGTSKRQQDSLRRYDKRRKTPTRYDQKRLRSRPLMSRAMLAHDVELVPSRLKDKLGARFIRARGAGKIMAHAIFGIVALTIGQLLKLAGQNSTLFLKKSCWRSVRRFLRAG
jgi:hypothetical protein